MEKEPGDDFIRRIASYIHTHEQGLAAAGFIRKRRAKNVSESSILNPLGWFATDNATGPPSIKPVIFASDAHHLFYLLMRLEAVGIDVGSLEVRIDSPSRPMNYVNIFPDSDKSETISLLSFRSSLSAVSRLSLGAGWWSRPSPPSVDSELKYIYSCFTKLPALSLRAPEARIIADMANEAPNENALPLDVFKNLQTLQCTDIDPRTLLGWDRLAESLRSLIIRNSGIEDVSDIFIGAVLDDQARRDGRAQDARTRQIPRGVSRSTSFYGTRLPDSVPETAEDEYDDTSMKEMPKPTSSTTLSSLKWAFLRHLSLADNALTFLSTSPLPYLTSLTHLDLSSNLLVSVPSGLSSLYNLVSLNLSDNMIDSVLGIYMVLGQVLYLNLSRNRLESICGLERLLALERVDLRQNVIEESAEIGRLATLPNIREVWVEGNPLVDLEEGYRIRCFDCFCKEGKSIQLDGSPPGLYEKMYLSAPSLQQMSSPRPSSVAYTPPVVAVGNPRVNSPSPVPSPLHSSSPSPTPNIPSPQLSAVKGRRKKNKRIVDLDGGHDTCKAGSSRSTSHAQASSRITRANHSGVTTQPDVLPQSDPQAGPFEVGQYHKIAPLAAVVPIAHQTTRSRHSRHYTEIIPAINGFSDDASMPTSTSPESLHKSASTSNSAARHVRVSASMHQPLTEELVEIDQFKQADIFRARMEALRSDMGDGWLKVFNQSQLGSPTGVPSR